MFERESFKAYVGDKSGNQYANGLNQIEKLYKADVDAEFAEDECKTLLDRIEQDKQRTDIAPKERKQRSDMASKLKRYIAFKRGTVQDASTDRSYDAVNEKIRFVIAKYKSDFSAIDSQERYKWTAIGWYKKHWNINAPDFSAMLASAFEKADSLLSANMYWPYKMMVEFAQADPETV